MTLENAVAAATAAAPVAADAGKERSKWLLAVAAALRAAESELVDIAEHETLIPRARLVAEVARTVGQLRMFADVVEEGSYLEVIIDHADPAARPPRPDLRRMLVPVGPVAVFSASNFPFAFSVLGGDTASAWTAGCPVIVKSHSGHPRLAMRTAQIADAALRAAGAPAGMLSLVAGRETGTALVAHSHIRAASFTGSLAGGRALYDIASRRPDPIPFYGELGSVNPVVVTPLAATRRADQIATGLVESFTISSGQLCTKPNVIFIPRDTPIGELAAALLGTSAPAPLLTASISDAFGEGWTRRSHVAGFTVLVPPFGDGSTGYSPALATLPLEAFVNQPLFQEELFGPATLLVTYDRLDDVDRALHAVEGSLTGSIHSEDDEDISVLVTTLSERVGRLIFQGWPTGVAVTWSQHHGGPWPATTSLHTSVGVTAVRRFQRPIVLQDAPERLQPPALRDDNPLGIPRRVDGRLTDRASRAFSTDWASGRKRE